MGNACACANHVTGVEDSLGTFEKELSKMVQLRKVAALQHIGLRTIMNNFRARTSQSGGRLGGTTGIAIEKMCETLKNSIETSGYSLDEEEIEAIDKVCKVLDVNEDQNVSFYEALAMLPLFCGGTMTDNERVLFEFMDSNGDCHLDRSEFQQYLHPVAAWIVKVLQLSPKQMETLVTSITTEVFTDIDTDKDHRISVEEWVTWQAEHNLYEVTKEKLVKCI